MTTEIILHKCGDRQRELEQVSAFLARLPEDKAWIVRVERFVKKRTEQQRKALFGAAYKALMEFIGLAGANEKEELHREMCKRYYGTRTDALGVDHPVRTTTRNEKGERDEINTEQALAFYAFLQREGAQYGCYVPDPDPQWRERAYTEEQT